MIILCNVRGHPIGLDGRRRYMYLRILIHVLQKEKQPTSIRSKHRVGQLILHSITENNLHSIKK